MSKSTDFYQNYPKLFHTYFKKVNSETVETLSLSGYQYYSSLIILDRILDDGVTNNTMNMILLQEESIKKLSSIFGTNPKFWNLWNKRRQEYISAINTEKKLNNLKEVTFNIYQDLADNKSSFGKVAIDALYILDDERDEDVYKTLLLSHKHFSVGFQLYDDVKDFEEDFKKEQFNYAIYELQKVIDFDGYNHNVKILNKLLFIKGLGQKLLAKSIEQFEQAIITLSSLNSSSKWLETVIEMKKTIEGYLDVTNGYLESIKARQHIKSHTPISYSFFEYNEIEDDSIKKALDYIRSDFKQNYADLKHIMYLGTLEGFNNKSQIHVSDTFQRALIDDCFITISQNIHIDISGFLKNECNYLVGLSNQDKIGGWAYFPTVQEIAADIDDLGQIIQLFIFSENHHLIDKYCNQAIKVTLNDRMLDNGGIETWIIPNKNLNPVQKKQDHFNGTKWGKGPDVEVVANFIYSLTILEKEQYCHVIEKAIAYILSQQNTAGYWESRWYYGNYYGTYVCLRALKAFEKSHPKEIDEAIQYLINTQNHDGGFSMNSNEHSDSLSTAFAILGLKLFSQTDSKAITKAIKYLNSTQHEDGAWKAVNFIRPKIHEPYKSKTLTTAFVLKAICT